MLNEIYYTILVINILMVLLKKQPKLILLIDLIFSAMLVTGTIKTNDYAIYKLMYEAGYARSSIEVGYNFLMDLSKNIGLSFDQFWMGWFFIFGYVYIWVFSQYSKNYPLLFSMYFIHLLFVDICQIRSFYAGALLLLGIHFLFKNKKLVFVILIVMSTLIHTEVVFFVPLVLFDFNSRLSVKFIKRMSLTVLVLCAGLFVLGTRINFLSQIAINIFSNLGAESKTAYFTTTTKYGFFLYFMLHLVAIFTTYYGRDNYQLDCQNNTYNTITDKVITLQLYCIFSFPLIMINMSFYRLFRIISIMTYISWAVMLDSMKLTGRYYCNLLLMFTATLLYRIPLVHGNSQIEMILDNSRYFG